MVREKENEGEVAQQKLEQAFTLQPWQVCGGAGLL